MSLINDALKQAQDAPAPSPANPQAGMEVAPPPPAPSPTGRRRRLIAIGVMAAVLAGAGWYYFKETSTTVPRRASAHASKPGAGKTPLQKIAQRASVRRTPSVVAKVPAKPAQVAKASHSTKSPAVAKHVATPTTKPAAEDSGSSVFESFAQSVTNALRLAVSHNASVGPATRPKLPPPGVPVVAAPAPAKSHEDPADPAPMAEKFDIKNYKLSGIILGDDGGTAVINGQSVSVGQRVDDVKIVKIERYCVEVEHAGKRFTLGM